jgi:BON domain
MGILDKAFGTAGAVLRLGGGIAAAGIERVRGGGGGGGGGSAPSSPVPKDIGDAGLTNKVRTVIFRGMRGVDKSAIDVNVVDGAVYLRGTARNPQQIRTLEARARAIPEVGDVHVLLHLPETPPDELARQGAGRQAAPLGAREDS